MSQACTMNNLQTDIPLISFTSNCRFISSYFTILLHIQSITKYKKKRKLIQGCIFINNDIIRMISQSEKKSTSKLKKVQRRMELTILEMEVKSWMEVSVKNYQFNNIS